MTFTLINAVIAGVLAVVFFGFHRHRTLAPGLLAVSVMLLIIPLAIEWLFAGNNPGVVLRLDGRIAAASASSIGASAGMFVAALLNYALSKGERREP